jgi:RNA exonuclease 4
MAPGLSENWKKLEAKIKAESSKQHPAKRKAEEAGLDPVGLKTGQRTKRHAGLDSRSRAGSSGRIVQTAPTSSRQSTRGTSSGKVKMGQSQSSKPVNVDAADLPSLAIWQDGDPDAATQADSKTGKASTKHENIAHAYKLGTKNNALLSNASRPNDGLTPGLEVGKYISIDCEMVGVGDGYQSALARVSIVDFHGQQVYDSYVRTKEPVTDWRTWVSGVSRRDMATAREFEEVQRQVSELLKDRILVGHDVRHDLEALVLDHPKPLIRDTAKLSIFKKYGHGPKPALRVLAREILGVEIQTGPHSSIEDARVAMLLFRRHKQAFDVEVANRFKQKESEQRRGPAKPTERKKKKKKTKRKA